jgi:hypothetical protein
VEDVTWNYAPGGTDLLHARAIRLPWAHHTRWNKTRFVYWRDKDHPQLTVLPLLPIETNED